MRILITGANGFIGASLSKHLIDQGHEVRGLVRETSDLSLLKDVALQYHVGSLKDFTSLQNAVKGIDLVYHVAAAVSDWGTWEYFREVNVEGTRNILEAAIQANVKRFVFVSSISVHSFIGGEDLDEDAPQLPTPFPYCQTKREAETLVIKAHQEAKIAVTIVRPGDVFGPGDRTSLMKMARSLEKGKMAYVGGGRTLASFTYIENLNEGFALAGLLDAAIGETYVITDGIRVSWREYFEKLTAALDLPRPKISIPPGLATIAAGIFEWIYRFVGISSRPPISRYLIAHVRKNFHFTNRKARQELGFEPQVNFDEAIQRTASWYRSVVRRDRESPPQEKSENPTVD